MNTRIDPAERILNACKRLDSTLGCILAEGGSAATACMNAKKVMEELELNTSRTPMHDATDNRNMGINPKGFNELQERLENIERNARKLDGENEVALTELFDPPFMREHTEFTSFDELLEASPWEGETQDDFKTIPEQELDLFIREHTAFTSYKEMHQVAGNQWVRKELNL